MEQLQKNTKGLEYIAGLCKVNPDEVIDDIADSMETANKLTKSLHSKDKTKDPYLQWWAIFLEEWGGKCFRRCLANVETKETTREWALWFGGFEALWIVGRDMVRITRLNDLKEGISKFIARESPSEGDIEEIWRWHNENTSQLDEAVTKMIDLFKEKQRQAFAQTLKELREYARLL